MNIFSKLVDWSQEITPKVLEWIIIGFLGFVITRLMDFRRNIHLFVDDWKLQYFHIDDSGGWKYKDNKPDDGKRGGSHDIRYFFTMRLFNEKSQICGLHRISIQFTMGPWYWRRVVFDDKKPYRGDGKKNELLGELSLKSQDWTVVKVVGYIDEHQITNADSVWFIAHRAAGKRFKRRISNLPRKRSFPLSFNG